MDEGYTVGSYPDHYSLETHVRFCWNDVLKLRGQGNPDPATEERVLQIICKTLYEDYPNMYDTEIPLALSAGVSGELGKDTWVSGSQVLQWLRAYNSHRQRIKVLDERHEAVRTYRMTAKERRARDEQAFKDGLQRGRESFLQHGTIFHADGFSLPQWARMVYDHYRAEGVIPEATDEDDMYADVKAEEYKSREKHPLSYDVEALRLREEDIHRAFLLEAYYNQEQQIEQNEK